MPPGAYVSENRSRPRRVGGIDLLAASIEEEKEREQRSARQQDFEQQIRTCLLRKISENSEAPYGGRSHVGAPSSSSRNRPVIGKPTSRSGPSCHSPSSAEANSHVSLDGRSPGRTGPRDS